MSTVSHYFCIFCKIGCDSYDSAFDHYCRHIFKSNNCEICDFNNVAETIGFQCSHQNSPLEEIKLKKNIVQYWIENLLSYQKKILDTTYEKLLVANKVCMECAVCRYLVEKYASNGGDMSRIEYIRDNKVEHCYQHMRYNPNSVLINSCISTKYDTSLRLKRIIKLEMFVERYCDTFFTAGEQINNNESLINISNIDYSSAIQDNDSECLSCSEDTETISQLSPSFEDTLQRSLAPILAKLSIVEDELSKTKTELQTTKNELLALRDEPILKNNKARKFYIQNISTGLVLDIGDWNLKPHARIQMYAYHGGRNQLWKYKDGIIHSALNNFALDISQGDCRSVITYPANGNPWQKWHFDADNTIRCEFHDLVLDVEHKSRDMCAKVTAYQKHYDHNQLFRIVYV